MNASAVDFIILVDHKITVQENESLEKYLGFTRDIKTLWNMKVEVRTLSTVLKILEKNNGKGRILIKFV